jgi:succinate dehydrogenase / fumarate reductase flavoprotein subunit
MEKYAPNKMELASRDVVSRAEQTEINEGRGFPDGTVALDITVVPRKRIHEALREIVNVGRDFAGVDITREPIHIKPGNHYVMGGVKTDVNGQTEVPGLYAAGECACVSVHGGNRLGANSLLDTLVFGRRSGAHAADRAANMVLNPPSEALLADEERRIGELMGRDRTTGRRVAELKQELGETLDRDCAVFREAEGLNTALEVVRRLQEEYKDVAIDDRGSIFNQDVLAALELGYMLDCAEATVVSAIHRTESRGASFRTDYPERNDEEWLKHIDVTLGADGEPKISYSPVTITQWQPEERKY